MSGDKHRRRDNSQQLTLLVSHLGSNNHSCLPMVFDLAFNDRRPRTWQITDKIDIEAQGLHNLADTGSGNAHNCIG